MNPQQRIIGVTFLVTATTIAAAELDKRDSLPEPERWIGLAFAFLVVGAVSDLGAPQVGAGLAVLLMVSTLAVRGDEALRFVGSWQRGRRGRMKGARKRQSQGGRRGTNIRGPRRADPTGPVPA